MFEPAQRDHPLEEQVKQGTDELRKKQTDAVFEK